MVSALGTIRLLRAYYYCPHCRHGHCPWEALLGLTDQALTPAASELTSLAGLLSGFEEACQKVLPKMAGIRLSESTVERTTEAVGERLGDALEQGVTWGEAPPWEWETDAAGLRCAYVSADATGVGQQGEHGEKVEGRMATVAWCSMPATTNRARRAT